MDQSRLDLQTLLESLVGIGGKAYFQPPITEVMQYPCIVYNRYMGNVIFANNAPYRFLKRYQVTVIDRDPDSPIPDKVAALPMCTLIRTFRADELNHDVFYLYF